MQSNLAGVHMMAESGGGGRVRSRGEASYMKQPLA